MLNDNTTKVDMQGVQLMKCHVMCHLLKILQVCKIQPSFEKDFYNPKHGIRSMQNHVTNEHNLNL
jgi:hypothetical protein